MNKFTNNGYDTKLGKKNKEKQTEYCPFVICILFYSQLMPRLSLNFLQTILKVKNRFFSRTISVDRIYSIELEIRNTKYHVNTYVYGSSLRNIWVINDHKYVPLVVFAIRFSTQSRFITGFVTRVTRQMPHMKQDILTRQEQLRF
jgi:hypothetical protein